MIHNTAVIESGAVIGKNVSIGAFSYIDNDVVIADGCKIGPHVTVLRHTTLGENCKVHAGAVLGDLPQDMGFNDEDSYVKIGSGCVIREGVTIHRGTKPGTSTEIGNGCFLMAFSHCAHNVRLGNNVILANGALLAGYVEVGDRAFVSGNVVIHQFVKIGRLAMLGGACGLSKDVPPFCMTRPMAANDIVGMNLVGLKRAGLKPEERVDVKKVFKVLFFSGMNTTQAVAEIKQSFQSALAMEICTFVEAAQRGICTASSGESE